MICPSKTTGVSRPKHIVSEILGEIAAQQVTVELVGPEEEALWNKLIRKHHYLKEHRMVGESLRYAAKQHGRWIALLGWSSAAFHLGPRDAQTSVKAVFGSGDGRNLNACFFAEM